MCIRSPNNYSSLFVQVNGLRQWARLLLTFSTHTTLARRQQQQRMLTSCNIQIQILTRTHKHTQTDRLQTHTHTHTWQLQLFMHRQQHRRGFVATFASLCAYFSFILASNAKQTDSTLIEADFLWPSAKKKTNLVKICN